MVQALKNFADANGGQLPVSGQIPDMVSLNDFYVGLQVIFLVWFRSICLSSVLVHSTTP